MFIVVLSGHLESVTVLLERGAVVDARDTDGNTPLFAAAFVHNPDIVDMLVSCGYILAWWINCIGAFNFLCKFLRKLSTIFQIAHGADVNARKKNGLSPLHIAAQEGQVCCI